MRFRGRILYLVDDPDLIRRQLRGDQLTSAALAAALRDDISTDEIIPARYCLDLGPVVGEHCYQGLRCGNELPVTEGSVARGGFAVCVAGLRRGKGSSREHAPYAEKRAGIMLLFARSFERIYRQNCHNIGIVTCTDFGLLPRIEAGDDVPLEELCADLEPLEREILAAGGLFPFSRASNRARIREDRVADPGRAAPATVAEKILVRHTADGTLRRRGESQFFACDWRYSHEYVTPMAAALLKEQAPGTALHEPDRILLFEDHLSAIAKAPGVNPETVAKADALARAQTEFAEAGALRLHGRVGDWSEGICHSLVVERYALPGQVIVGSDSHTCHVGALGCVAFGVGASDIANSWISGEALLRVPRQIMIRIDGSLGPGVTEKDLMLDLLARAELRTGQAIGAIVEYAGETVSGLDVDARCTLTNMAAEMGATSGIVSPDERTVEFLTTKRGLDPEVASAFCAGLGSDPGARYDLELSVNAAHLGPMVALPGDPGNSVPVADLDGGVTIGRAYGGSCTAAKRSDMDMYAAVLTAALADGRHVHPDVQFYIQVGSQGVMAYCQQQGYVDLFEQAGAVVLGPSCGACINAGPGASTKASDVAISAQNRNFPGRSGPGSLYLASPLTVAASAIEGRICQFVPRG
jgi:3-isopropylmalate/(R)-2-methylmalate dehydratase large subunit